MMNFYSADIEFDTTTANPDDYIALTEKLADYHPAAGPSPRGWLSVQISLPAESLPQATQTALALANAALPGVAVIAIQMMPEAEFDARQGFQTIPDLLSVSEAAEVLGVSRTRVQQLVDDHKLQSQRVGNAIVLTRASVEARRDSGIATALR
jgi:excisionase family DNA binding protein